LPDPEAGLGYLPGLLTGGTVANQNSQRNGYLTELRFANTIATDPRQTVVRWGSNVNSRGADIVSVRDDGTVWLWDTKFRSNPGFIRGTATFTPNSTALANALEQARIAIDRNVTLPPAVRAQALLNLRDGNFNAHTPGAGAVRNSAISRFCGFAVCRN
jgi:filamentous hemagglutinin